jgi:hypothetical protein
MQTTYDDHRTLVGETVSATRPRRITLTRLGGAALLAVPPLMLVAMLTSPPQDGEGTAAYVASLAADHTMTALSAGLFHYGWVAIAFGALAAATLVRGPRGRALTSVGAVATAFGAIQFTGLLFLDWFLWAMGNQLESAQAVGVFESVMADAWVASWLMSAKVFGLLGLPLLMAGLARAGVVGWWTVPVILFPMVLPGILPGLLGTAAGLLAWAPLVLVGLRLVQRPVRG